ncbi:hypothetical protein R3P38DRAFT_3189731 [Favolaschia claudopus]|uniref:Uncharacterized protein n=1 Tax=Favolaschia claudopus TaxID=2862362 RepID=A0AAW0BN76_9AGAR
MTRSDTSDTEEEDYRRDYDLEPQPLFGPDTDIVLTPQLVQTRVHKQLARADLDPEPTLACMRQNPAIVSGSTTLPVLVDAKFPPNDLDLYTTAPYETAMINMMHRAEYGDMRMADNPYREMQGILRTHWLKKGKKVVNIIIVPDDNAATAIFHFHSTIVMNYFSGYGVFCAYPALTLARKGILNSSVAQSDAQRRRVARCIDKYTLRGFDMKTNLNEHKNWEQHTCAADASCPTTFRSLHDHASLFIPFPDFATAATAAPVYDGRTSVVWSLGGDACTAKNVYHKLFSVSTPIFVKEKKPITFDPDIIRGLAPRRLQVDEYTMIPSSEAGEEETESES